ncbi:C4-dicarboxylate TRAP transporter substrate-binding protein [Jannaschia sp. LMIT008]|uniref:C4-dicarboxylate TRAP transporter substrate-binding protein n=1 Tax=Jannaschia maritima TaxID=3032585 RepID=UPI0028115085|nr:C4-dicarboxylate TRAP transporter substrate-binding protein [Jannaschia sp. LMIT008]
MRPTAIVAAALFAATGAQAQVEFIANSFYSAQAPFSKYGYTEWAERVRDLSNGELAPEVYTGTVLLAPRASMQGVRDNIVQVAHHAAVYTPSELPVANAVQELGFNYDDPLAAILAVTEFSMTNEDQLQEWRDKGMVYLGGYATPPYILFCREPIRTLDEFQGKRIRTAGSTVSLWVEAAGGVPVNVPSSEMYTGLERGTLDCASNAASDLIDRSLWEVAEHTTVLPTGMYYSGPQWGFNPGFWASLSPEHRSVLMEATAQTIGSMMVNYIANAEAALVTAAERGNTIHEPAEDLAQSADDFRAQAIDMAYEMAADRYGLSNGRELIDEFRATYDRWQGLLDEIDRTDPEAIAELAMTEIYDKIDPETYGVE